jgi:hypothetical protein
MCSVIHTLAEYKLNLVSFYVEHLFRYDHSPDVAPEGAEIYEALYWRRKGLLLDEVKQEYNARRSLPSSEALNLFLP